MIEAISIISLAGLAYYFDNFIDACKEKSWVKEERQQLTNCSGFFPLEQQKQSKLVDFRISTTKNVAYIEVDATQAVNLNSNTFFRVRQSIPYSLRYQPSAKASRDFLQGQSGNSFIYNIKPPTPITIDFKCCNFQRNSLTHTVQSTDLLNNTNAFFINEHISLRALPYFSMLGILTYSIENKEFQFSPSFLINTLNRQDFFKTVDLFYKQKLNALTVKQLLSGLTIIGVIGVIYLLNSEYLNSKWNRWWGIDKIQDSIKTISARQESKLRCECGECMNIFGECLHLSMCKKCYEVNNACRICAKAITKPVTIFI